MTTASGDAVVSSVNGTARLRTASGDVRIRRYDGEDLLGKTSAGDLTGWIPAKRRIDVDLQSLSGSLRNQCALSDLKMNRLLDRIDEWATEAGIDDEVGPPHRFAPTRVEASPPLGLDLTDGQFRTVIWATGFRPDYSWLDVDVLDRKGRVRHDGGVVASPGLYLMGLPFLRRRKSSLIDGAGDDARDLSAHLADHLEDRSARAQVPVEASAVP